MLFTFFPDEIIIVDYKDMTISYLISSSVGSQNLIQMFIIQGLLPRPMGVRIRAIIYYPIITQFFAFSSYKQAAPPLATTGFNSYNAPLASSSWLSYADTLIY